jgi:phosphoserine phosphatase
MPTSRKPKMPQTALLQSPGWTPATRTWLERLIRRGAGQGLPVAFDFDNTLVCGDIGEATLALLVKQRRLKPEVIAALAVPFCDAAGKRIRADRLPDLTAYYEALLEGSGHGAADPNPLTSGYTWAVEIMSGLSPAAIVRATAACAARARTGEVRRLEVTAGQTAYPLPWFYPQMVELLAALIVHRFDVWIVSASNAWSVRWMVLNVLNPQLARLGAPAGVSPDHVIGVSLMVRDRAGRLLKDPLLVREKPAYARLDATALRAVRLTPRLHLPVPVYSGKVACLWDVIGQPPYLAAGDSPGDLPMLGFAENRLWLARLEKPDYTTAMLARCQGHAPDSWAVQPTLVKASPGFVPDRRALELRLATPAAGVKATARMLEPDWV